VKLRPYPEYKDSSVPWLGEVPNSLELQRFAAQEYRFEAQAETNDMWLELDFNDPVFERAVVEYVRNLLAVHYPPFARVRVDEQSLIPVD
jgi:hypothetical protein